MGQNKVSLILPKIRAPSFRARLFYFGQIQLPTKRNLSGRDNLSESPNWTPDSR